MYLQKPNKAMLVRVQRILALLNLLPQLQNTGFSVFQRLSSFLGVGIQCPRFSLMSRPRQEQASLQAGEDRFVASHNSLKCSRLSPDILPTFNSEMKTIIRHHQASVFFFQDSVLTLSQ